jgi:predicted metal-dependent HD superfamily phosphohydrolase
LAGAAETLRQQAGSSISADDRTRYEEAIRRVYKMLGEPDFQTAWSTGRAMALEEIVAYACVWVSETVGR